MTTQKSFFIGLLALCIVEEASSQVPTAAEVQQRAEAAAQDTSQVAIVDTLPAFLDGIAIEAGQANNKASINVKREIGNKAFIANLSTPVNKEDVTSFASLEGLASDLSFSLSWSGFYMPFDAKKAQADVNAVCNKYGLPNDQCDQQSLMKAVALQMGLAVADIPVSQIETKLREQILPQQSANDQKEFEKRVEQALVELDVAQFQNRWAKYWALNGEIGRKPTTYFQANGVKKDETNLPYALSASFGWIGRSSRLSLRGRYEMRFKDGKKARQCQPFSGTDGNAGLEACEELPFGAPSESEAFVVNTELRWFFTKWALSPIVSYDLEEEVLGLQLPVYLIRDSNGDLTGGFRLGWRDDTNDFVASVFVSKPLSLGN